MAATELATLKGRCDICDKKDKFYGFNLQRCKSCGVAVHETCYGAVQTKGKDPNWECMVCRIAEGGNTGQLECALCSVSHGIHAMHPLYDTHGRRGKQLVIGGKKAWVHTLCALFVGTNEITKGTVYGCNEDGEYEGDDSEPTDEDSSASSVSDEDDDGKPRAKKGSANTKDSDVCEVHHYVICDAKEVSPWATAIRESRKLKCTICGHKDIKGSLRIPVQCAAGGSEELPEFRERHRGLRDTCYQPMHVGCARWNPDPNDGDPPYPRIYFYPGTLEYEEDKVANPICCAYCDLHAKDIKDYKKKEKAEKPSAAPTSPQPRKKSVRGQPTLETNAADPVRRTSLTKSTPAADPVRRTSLTKTPAKPAATTTAATATATYSEELFKTILQDVVERIRNAKKSKNNDKLTDVTTEAKEYWREKANLPEKTFKVLWSDVKKNAIKIIESDKVPATKKDDQAEQQQQEPEPMDIDQETALTPNTVAPVMDIEQNPNQWAKYWMPYYRDSIQFEWKEEV